MGEQKPGGRETEAPIDRYLAASGRTARDLAEAAGIDEHHLSNLRHGRKRLGARVALALVEASGRAIDLEELLRWRPPSPRRRAA